MVEPQVLLREYDYSTEVLGMGLRFRERQCELRAILEELCGVDNRNPKTVRDRAEPEPA